MSESSSIATLAEGLRADLARLAPGERLPSTRRLVETHRVSPVTVSRALAELAAEGLVVTRPGAGTFRAPPRPAPPVVDLGWQTVALADREIDTRGLSTAADRTGDERTISLSTGYLHPSLMPVRALTTAADRAIRRPGVWEAGSTSGLSGLRNWFARTAGSSVDARDVTITSGGQATLSTVLRALVPAGEALVVESPTYPGSLAVARAAGIRPVPVPTDEGGMIPSLLADALARTRARALLLQPTYQNPTGAVLAAQRRDEVLAAARDAGAFVVEDDYARWLGHATPGSRGPARPAPPLLHSDPDGRVVHISSLTKVTSPTLRIAAVIARGPVVERLRALRLVDEMFVPRPLQETALQLVSRPAWDRHLAFLGEQLALRCAAFVRGVATHLPGVTLTARPIGGLHVWVRLPDSVDDVATAEAARWAGVTVLPGRPFFPAEPPAPHLRLTYSAAADVAELDAGLQRLAAAAPALRG